jgi:hypothetical protein
LLSNLCAAPYAKQPGQEGGSHIGHPDRRSSSASDYIAKANDASIAWPLRQEVDRYRAEDGLQYAINE